MATTRSAADFGSSKSGLSTVGYQLRNDDGTANGSRVTSGIVEQGHGVYSAAAVTIPTGFSGFIRWDTGEDSPLYASAPYPDGEAFVAALKADGEWKTVLANVNGVFDYNANTRILTLKNKAGDTVLATLTLTIDSNGVVTHRASA